MKERIQQYKSHLATIEANDKLISQHEESMDSTSSSGVQSTLTPDEAKRLKISNDTLLTEVQTELQSSHILSKEDLKIIIKIMELSQPQWFRTQSGRHDEYEQIQIVSDTRNKGEAKYDDGEITVHKREEVKWQELMGANGKLKRIIDPAVQEDRPKTYSLISQISKFFRELRISDKKEATEPKSRASSMVSANSASTTTSPTKPNRSSSPKTPSSLTAAQSLAKIAHLSAPTTDRQLPHHNSHKTDKGSPMSDH